MCIRDIDEEDHLILCIALQIGKHGILGMAVQRRERVVQDQQDVYKRQTPPCSRVPCR